MASAERTEIIEIPMKSFFTVITDYSGYTNFVTGMKEVKILEDKGKQKKVHFDLEMMRRMQYVVNVEESLDEGSGQATVFWTLESSDFFKINNGRWTLKSLGPEKTEVRYELDVEFSFSVPGFILKGLIANALPSTIKEFSKQASARA